MEQTFLVNPKHEAIYSIAIGIDFHLVNKAIYVLSQPTTVETVYLLEVATETGFLCCDKPGICFY